MRLILLGSIAVLLVFVVAFSKKPHTPALDKLADRVERLDVIPEETRQELTRLIERMAQDAKVSDSNDRHAKAVARIERAMQFKPVELSPK